MFLLHTLAEMYKRKNMKLFCCFIDFQKAFDSVWRAGLWAKLWNYNVHGNFFTVIRNMYNDIKSCIAVNGEFSDFFQSCRGVRQGENLSPILFSIFLNDLEHYLLTIIMFV